MYDSRLNAEAEFMWPNATVVSARGLSSGRLQAENTFHIGTPLFDTIAALGTSKELLHGLLNAMVS